LGWPGTARIRMRAGYRARCQLPQRNWPKRGPPPAWPSGRRRVQRRTRAQPGHRRRPPARSGAVRRTARYPQAGQGRPAVRSGPGL